MLKANRSMATSILLDLAVKRCCKLTGTGGINSSELVQQEAGVDLQSVSCPMDADVASQSLQYCSRPNPDLKPFTAFSFALRFVSVGW
jgi:hypothetical protein